jgi:hypothetical protein
VKVRNPWGEKEWMGAASDSDTKFWKGVSANDKKRLNYNTVNDGIFFMIW